MAGNPDIPRHIAVIMDGNGRWANEQGKPRIEGHRSGADSVQAITEECVAQGIEYLTLYAFSSENWNRPKAEVTALMHLLDRFLVEKLKLLQDQNIRFQAIGQLDRLPEKTRKRIAETTAITAGNSAMTLVLALSYGGREEITSAARSLAQAAIDGTIRPEDIDNTLFAQHLYTADIPDPDLLIRTSGEMRISNFLLWQISYAEIIVVKKCWPDFGKPDLRAAIAEYQKRHRRFGGL